MTPFDLDLATTGYLRSPDARHVRHVSGLDRLAREALCLQARLYWHATSHAGLTYCWSRVILLAPWLYDARPVIVRCCLAHELAHLHAGPSEDRVRAWLRTFEADFLH